MHNTLRAYSSAFYVFSPFMMGAIISGYLHERTERRALQSRKRPSKIAHHKSHFATKKKSNLKFSSCNSSARGELLAISWRSETEESKEFQKPFNKSFALRWGQTNERFCSHELDRSFLLIAKKRIVFDCVKLKLLKYPKLDNWIN